MDGEGRECREHILERTSGTSSRGRNASGTAFEDEYRTYSGRLQGSNRYDPMDGGGRVAPGAATESRVGTPIWI